MQGGAVRVGSGVVRTQAFAHPAIDAVDEGRQRRPVAAAKRVAEGVKLARIDLAAGSQQRRVRWCSFRASPPSNVSARATLPSAALAAASPARDRHIAMLARRSGGDDVGGRKRPQRSLRQRDRMVGSTRPGAWLTSRNSDCRGGSSRSSTAHWRAFGLNSSTESTIQTRQPSTPAVDPKNPMVSPHVVNRDQVRSLPLSFGDRSSASSPP